MPVSSPLSARILLVGAVAACLVACGKSALPVSIGATAHPNPVAAPKPNNGIDPDMVGAVNLAGAPATPVSMKFRLSARPQVTTPLQVRILVIPSPEAQITAMHLSFQPGDGLQLQSERTVDVPEAGSGAPVQQDITVVPQQSGLLSLSATVLVDTATESISRTYFIPLIASDGHG
jgi:hypothetical protein